MIPATVLKHLGNKIKNMNIFNNQWDNTWKLQPMYLIVCVYYEISLCVMVEVFNYR